MVKASGRRKAGARAVSGEIGRTGKDGRRFGGGGECPWSRNVRDTTERENLGGVQFFVIRVTVPSK